MLTQLHLIVFFVFTDVRSNALHYNPPDSFVYEEAMVSSALCRHHFFPQLYSLVENGTVLLDGRVICGSNESPSAYAASLSSVLTGFSRLHLEGTTRRLFMTEDDPAHPSFKQVQERIDAAAYDSLRQFFGDLRAMVSLNCLWFHLPFNLELCCSLQDL